MAWSEVALGATALGGVTRAAGEVKGGQASQQMYNYRAALARQMSKLYGQIGERTVEAGSTQAGVQSLRGAEAVGQAKADQAASGVDVNTGSAVGVRAGIAKASKYNALTTLSNAQLQNWGYQVKSQEENAQAGLYTMSGNNAVAGADIAALSDLLGTASQVGAGWNTGDGGGGGSVTVTTPGGSWGGVPPT